MPATSLSAFWPLVITISYRCRRVRKVQKWNAHWLIRNVWLTLRWNCTGATRVTICSRLRVWTSTPPKRIETLRAKRTWTKSTKLIYENMYSCRGLSTALRFCCRSNILLWIRNSEKVENKLRCELDSIAVTMLCQKFTLSVLFIPECWSAWIDIVRFHAISSSRSSFSLSSVFAADRGTSEPEASYDTYGFFPSTFCTRRTNPYHIITINAHSGSLSRLSPLASAVCVHLSIFPATVDVTAIELSADKQVSAGEAKHWCLAWFAGNQNNKGTDHGIETT